MMNDDLWEEEMEAYAIRLNKAANEAVNELARLRAENAELLESLKAIIIAVKLEGLRDAAWTELVGSCRAAIAKHEEK